MPIADQMVLQMLFLMARLLMVMIMIGTLAAAYGANESHFGQQASFSGPARDVPLADFSNFILLMQICVFSTAFQFSVPGIAYEVKKKKHFGNVIQYSVTFIYVSNLILSLVMAIFFGRATDASSNLNWDGYHGGTWDGIGEVRENRAAWASFLSGYVVMFAALDGLAVYPLIAVSLGEILMGAIYEDRVHEMEKNWKIRTCFRLLASAPQAIGSIFVKDLGTMYVV
jgi:hypothetical protein